MPQTPEDVRAALMKIRAARGFVLPHHGAMAAALPELHDAYEAMYRALTLEQRHLNPLEKEVVWLAILAACEEPVGKHHLHRFRQAGGDDGLAEAVFRLVGWAAGARRWACMGQHWQAQFAALPAAQGYLDGLDALLRGGALAPGLARLALLGIHAACEEEWGLRVVLRSAYALGVDEPRMAEAMSLVIWPRGVNRFVKATATWLQLIRSGEVEPSPAFRAWAEVAGQGAFSAPPQEASAAPPQEASAAPPQGASAAPPQGASAAPPL
jgi:alkylhydroperoxidase/carboxymuconolactone decarboxylase family protein YurZ